jgi:hypothetical protein
MWVVNSIDELVKYRWQQNIQKLMIKQPIPIIALGYLFAKILQTFPKYSDDFIYFYIP